MTHRSMRNILLSAALITALPPCVHAADLLDTYRAAQSQDAVFASSRASYKAGQEKLPQGRSMLLPSVNLNANSSFNDMVTSYAAPFPPSGHFRYNSHGYGATLVQPLFREQNWAAYTEGELQATQAEAQFKLAENDLALRAARTYFDVLMAQDSVELVAAQKAAIYEQLQQAKRNFEVGTATITDTHEAQSRFDLIASQEIAAQGNLEIKKRGLQQMTGVSPDNLLRLNGTIPLVPPQPSDIGKWVDAAQQNNLQIAAAQTAAELADKEVDRNRGGHLPTVDLVASYNRTYANGSNFGMFASDSRNTMVGVQLNMPLFQGGMVQSKWREAEANRDRARSELENAKRNVELQTRQAYLGVVNGIAQVQALLQALKSSESLLASSKLGQQVGVRTNIDVLNAQQQLYSTRRDLYQAEYNYLLSLLQLKAATGAINEEDVAEVNRAMASPPSEPPAQPKTTD